MKLQEYYQNVYPMDELGAQIREDANFVGLLGQLHVGHDPYDYIGVYDSIVRERLFEHLAQELGTPYDYVYNLWLK
jgi:hypothetical protein